MVSQLKSLTNDTRAFFSFWTTVFCLYTQDTPFVFSSNYSRLALIVFLSKSSSFYLFHILTFVHTRTHTHTLPPPLPHTVNLTRFLEFLVFSYLLPSLLKLRLGELELSRTTNIFFSFFFF